jgi:transcription-repair coupling factor (superfamily II helicase)
LRESQTLRLQRLYPKSVVKAPVRTILVPRPTDAPPGRFGGQPLRDVPLLRWVGRLASDMLDSDKPAT